MARGPPVVEPGRPGGLSLTERPGRRATRRAAGDRDRTVTQPGTWNARPGRGGSAAVSAAALPVLSHWLAGHRGPGPAARGRTSTT
eukprot:200023-Hanusia_phi.AAC.2